MNSICVHSVQHHPDTTDRADGRWETKELRVPFGWRVLYLYGPVVLNDNSVGSVPKKVSENQEMIAVLSLFTGQVKTTWIVANQDASRHAKAKS